MNFIVQRKRKHETNEEVEPGEKRRNSQEPALMVSIL